METHKILRTALSSMNYLFISHVNNDIDVVGNDKIEGELYSFFCSIIESEIQNSSTKMEYFKSLIIYELKDCSFSIPLSELKKRVLESVYIILGYRCPCIENLYLDCIEFINHSEEVS